MGKNGVVDELEERKTPFIQNAFAFAKFMGGMLTPAIIGGKVKKALLMVALDDIGGETPQIILTGMGEPEFLEKAAEALVNHPEFGHLLVSKVMERVIANGELTAEIIEVPKSKKGDTTVN